MTESHQSFILSFWIWMLVRVLIYSKLEINFFTLEKKLVGTSGLEPPTSRLSGVRSNHLSYAPSFLHKHSLCGENVQFVSQTDVWLPVTFVSPSALCFPLRKRWWR